MKNLKLVSQIICFIFLASCEFNQEIEDVNFELAEAMKADNNGILMIGEKTYVFNNNANETITKFVKKTKGYEFFYNQESLNIDKENGYQNFRVSEGNYIIENEATGEFLKFINFKESGDGVVTFDVIASNGTVLRDLTFNYPIDNAESSVNSRVTCVWCYAIPLIKLAEAVLDSIGDNLDSNCALAMNLCANGGGVPEVELTEGFFGSSCSVTCMPAPAPSN